MNFYLRQNKILQLLAQRHSLSVHEFAGILEVSENTVRNDLYKLAQQGKLMKVHGGASSIITDINTPLESFSVRFKQNTVEKTEIAQIFVANLPQVDGLSLFIDPSTTNIEIAKLLAQGSQRITIVTNFYDVIHIVQDNPNIMVFFVGGKWASRDHYCRGPVAQDNITTYHTDIAILGCDGIDIYGGLKGIYDCNTETMTLKQAMSINAQETWICADHTKFNKKSLMHVFPFSSVHAIVTDSETKERDVQELRKHNIKVFHSLS